MICLGFSAVMHFIDFVRIGNRTAIAKVGDLDGALPRATTQKGRCRMAAGGFTGLH